MDRTLILRALRIATLRAWKNPDASQSYLREILDSASSELRQEYLEILLVYAQNSSPFYASRIKSNFLNELPLLSKEDLRASLSVMRTPHADVHNADKNISGGSSGEPTVVLQDRMYDQWGYATEEYYLRHFLGIDPKRDAKVILWGSLRDIRQEGSRKRKFSNWISRTTFLNAYDAGERQWPEFAQVLQSVKPRLVRGYANALCLFSRYVLENNISLPAPHAIISSAEMLRPDMRRDIEKAFKTQVLDFYGSREVGPMAGECRHGKLHVFEFNNIIEVVDPSTRNALPAGEIGEIAVTNLHNLSGPLIRYRIGDRGAFDTSPCSCGNALPVLQKLDGRVTDSLETRDGKIVDSGYFRTLFLDKPWVRQFQITQIDYERVEVAIVGEAPSNVAQQTIDASFRKVLGEKCALEWKFVQKIELTPQGKALPVRNFISKSRARVAP